MTIVSTLKLDDECKLKLNKKELSKRVNKAKRHFRSSLVKGKETLNKKESIQVMAEAMNDFTYFSIREAINSHQDGCSCSTTHTHAISLICFLDSARILIEQFPVKGQNEGENGEQNGIFSCIVNGKIILLSTELAPRADGQAIQKNKMVEIKIATMSIPGTGKIIVPKKNVVVFIDSDNNKIDEFSLEDTEGIMSFLPKSKSNYKVDLIITSTTGEVYHVSIKCANKGRPTVLNSAHSHIVKEINGVCSLVNPRMNEKITSLEKDYTDNSIGKQLGQAFCKNPAHTTCTESNLDLLVDKSWFNELMKFFVSVYTSTQKTIKEGFESNTVIHADHVAVFFGETMYFFSIEDDIFQKVITANAKRDAPSGTRGSKDGFSYTIRLDSSGMKNVISAIRDQIIESILADSLEVKQSEATQNKFFEDAKKKEICVADIIQTPISMAGTDSIIVGKNTIHSNQAVFVQHEFA